MRSGNAPRERRVPPVRLFVDTCLSFRLLSCPPVLLCLASFVFSCHRGSYFRPSFFLIPSFQGLRSSVRPVHVLVLLFIRPSIHICLPREVCPPVCRLPVFLLVVRSSESALLKRCSFSPCFVHVACSSIYSLRFFHQIFFRLRPVHVCLSPVRFCHVSGACECLSQRLSTRDFTMLLFAAL